VEALELNGNVGIGILTKILLGAGENSYVDLIYFPTHFTFRFYNINFGTEIVHKYLS
jgi:hypothetical protein